MKKVIDCFLFFQEVDLLEIRLKYLDPYVDIFIIVEACQTFTGVDKRFVFEENKERYADFLDKIVYYKITDSHLNYDSVISHLRRVDSETSNKVSQFMEGYSHFPKDELHWVLDAYHKNCMHFPLAEIAKDNDIIFFSDIDEIPSKEIFTQKNFSTAELGPILCIQKEFSYFFNYYRIGSKWLGSIFGEKSFMASMSMNNLRLDAQGPQEILAGKLDDGGYHFTSVASIDDIRKKIESWGHQEFNNPRVKKNLEYKIASGQDPFGRQAGTIFLKVEPNNPEYFDNRMGELIIQYPNLIANKDIEQISLNLFLYLKNKVELNYNKVINKLSKWHKKRV